MGMKPGRVMSKRRAGTSTSLYSSMDVGECKRAVGTCVQLEDESFVFIPSVTDDSISGFRMVSASKLQLPLNVLQHDVHEHAYMLMFTQPVVIGSRLSIIGGLTHGQTSVILVGRSVGGAWADHTCWVHFRF